MSEHHSGLVVGGGSGGLAVAARLRSMPNAPDVAIVEPSDNHSCQPLWTLVGGGVFEKETIVRDEADYIPDGATWIRDRVASFEPRENATETSGDASSLPTSRTGAAIRKQAPGLVENLPALGSGASLRAQYDGHASCPLVTGYGKLVLAEFDYDGRPAESFRFDQARERYSMCALKAYGLPQMYGNGTLHGRM